MKNGLFWVIEIARRALQSRPGEFEDQLQKLEIRAINNHPSHLSSSPTFHQAYTRGV
jgi:hypothetical protein